MIKIYTISIVALLLVLSAYVFSQSSSDDITVQELIEMIGSEQPPVILDVRNPDELVGELGHIDGVVNIPVHQLEGRISELNKYKNKKIAVICRSGNRSRYATAILKKKGFKALNVKGGMREYRRLTNK